MMSIGHFTDAGGYLDYGEAAILFPIEELQAEVLTHRDAELILEETSAESVLAVRPTGVATGYALTQRPLTAVEIASPNNGLRAELSEVVDTELAQFDIIQIGRATRPAQNRSLAEF